MKIKEVLTEMDHHADPSQLPPEHQAALYDTVSIPGISQNKSNGSSYAQYRFGLALAGAPDFPTKAAGAIAGDPLLSAFTDEEIDMINSAAKMVGAGEVRRMSNNRSEEMSNTNKTSPVPARKKNKYGV